MKTDCYCMTEKYVNFKENSIGLEKVNERLAM